MPVSIDQIVSRFDSAKASGHADYDVLSSPPDGVGKTHLAVARSGAPALIIPVAKVASQATRLTQGLALRGASSLEFARGDERWSSAAAVVECRDAKLLLSFAALVCALVARLESATAPSWDAVSRMFAEWERLLGRRQLLTGETELGLWGELWFLDRTRRPADLLEGWRGPDADHVDFLLDGCGFEVKAGRRPGVHVVSQDQVERPLGDADGMLVSMHVMPDPVRGRSLAELVRSASRRMTDVATFEQKLAATGYSRDDDGAYQRKYALLEQPKFYDVEDVPRVRAADPGVSKIRFRVEMNQKKALSGERLTNAVTAIGIDPSAHEYPCA